MGARKGVPQPRGADRVAWTPVVERAAAIVDAEPYGMTLRGLFYRLVSEQRLRNTIGHYNTLSRRTAEARRAGAFPDLIDQTRMIRRPLSWDDPADALAWLVGRYRIDRTQDQERAVYVGVEKNALLGPLSEWVDELGVPVLALGGYSSQTFVDLVARDIEADERESVLIYAGDFDPSGEDIGRDFLARTGVFSQVERIALSEPQIDEFDLPPQVGKASDPRAADFVARYGRLIQVELEALPLAELRRLYLDAVRRVFNNSNFSSLLKREQRGRERLEELKRRESNGGR